MNKSLIRQLHDNLHVFQGVLGDTALGIEDIVFPSALLAARFVEYHKIEHAAWFSDENGVVKFTGSVKIQIDTKR